eukprot:752661-Hanusia_phi.AAC.6
MFHYSQLDFRPRLSNMPEGFLSNGEGMGRRGGQGYPEEVCSRIFSEERRRTPWVIRVGR